MFLSLVTRNLLKRPVLNLIKVLGLSLSLICILFITLFLKKEFAYDRFNKNHEKIYRFTVTDQSLTGGRHYARIDDASYIPELAGYFPGIQSFVRLAPMRGGVLKSDDEFITFNEAFECDSTFFNVFTARIISGDPANVLNSPGSMVVSESFAMRKFGTTNLVGKILILPEGQYYGRNYQFTVRGIMKDFPQASHFHPELIATPVDRSVFTGWAWTYLLLSENANPEKIASGYKEFCISRLGKKAEEAKSEAHLQKLTEIHLHSNKLREIEVNGNMSFIYALSFAAMILLVIGLANYSNLNIGMADFSRKFLFISKVSGSTGLDVIKYILYEGLIIILFSVLITVICAIPARHLIRLIFGPDLFDGNGSFIIIVIAMFCLTALAAGIIPLLKQGLSGITGTTDNKNNQGLRRMGLSKSIIILQYTISITLIISVIVIRRQTDYSLENSMGFNGGNLICLEDVHTGVQEKFEVFKAELLKNSSVKYVSAMFEPPGGETNDMFRFELEGYIGNEANKIDDYIGIFPCDYSFASIFNLSFIAGVNFSETNEDNEGSGEYIINESAMKRLSYSDPTKIIGKKFRLISGIDGVNIPAGNIIGVVQDFHLSSMKKTVEPLVLFKRKDLWLINFVISYQPGKKDTAVSDIKNVWEKMFPGYPLRYSFVDSLYENVYRTEILQSRFLSIFTIVALIICSMGMLGLTILTTQRRTKEIGIRKINGALTREIMVMINLDLIKWILLAFFIAVPISYYFMLRWLGYFAYKRPISWIIFAVAGLVAIIITLITISYQSWRASSRNPVESLRYE